MNAHKHYIPGRLSRALLVAGMVLTIGQTTTTAAPEYRNDRVLVQPVARAKMAATHEALGASLHKSYPEMGNLQVVKLPAGMTVPEAIEFYESSGLAARVEPDYKLRAQGISNDPFESDGTLWRHHNVGQSGGVTDADIDAREAWDIRTSAGNVIVAVIDTGVRLTHEDLGPNLWVNPGESGANATNGIDDDGNGYVDDVHGINALTGTGSPADDNGHGSHVSGILGGAGNNGTGITGIAWNVQIMALKALDASAETFISDAIESIAYAKDHGAKIICASWGDYDYDSQALLDAIESARDAGMIFVAACGNNGSDNDANPLYPASYNLDNIVSVAATTRTDALAGFSNFGASTVDLGAPGTESLSAGMDSDSTYQFRQGTSMATPLVAGTCALVWAQYPSEDYKQIINRVLANVDPNPALAGKSTTGGRLNTFQALGTTPPPTPVVQVTATTSAASESGPTPGVFTFTRSGDTTSQLTVFFSLAGTAQNMTDYSALPLSVTISAGQSSAIATVNPISDTEFESSETVELALSPSASYDIGAASSAVVTISDHPILSRLPMVMGGLLPAMDASHGVTPGGMGVQDFSFLVTGNPEHTYPVEASQDLVTWTPITTVEIPVSQLIEITDSDIGNLAHRFYRIGNIGVVSFAEEGESESFLVRSDRMMVKPRQGVDLTLFNGLHGTTTLAVYPDLGNLTVLGLPSGTSVAVALQAYRESGLVLFAEPDPMVRAMATPNDTFYSGSLLWGLHNTGQFGGSVDADIDAPEAWDINTDASGVVVAVIDTGVQTSHSDFTGGLWTNLAETPGNGIDDDNNGYVDDVNGANVIMGHGDVSDDHGHGTHVAGIIGARGNNSAGVTGVAWLTQLMAIKSLDSQGDGSVSDLLAAIQYARDMGADIINAGWGGTTFQSEALQHALAAARDDGILVVTAAGNTSQNLGITPLYPASYNLENIISVAATDRNDNLAYFGSHGSASVDLGAPGHEIYSTWISGNPAYMYHSGSSMAAAYVSGAAALTSAQFPGESLLSVKQRILAGVDAVSGLQGLCVTGGRLNLAGALSGGTPSLAANISVTATDAVATEAGTSAGIFTIRRTGDTSATLTVNYVVSGTAQSGSDFISIGSSTTMAFGAETTTISVTPIQDSLPEGLETVTLTLAGGGYLVTYPAQATIEIQDNDTIPSETPVISASVIVSNASENGGDAVIALNRSGDTSQAINVHWTLSGTAVNGTDYVELPLTSTFPAGETQARLIVVPIADLQAEGTETVTLTLLDNASYDLGAQSMATVTISDGGSGSSPLVTVQASDPNADENGNDPGTFTISRTGSTASSLTVNFAVTGTATAGSDYTAIGTSVTIPSGFSSTTVTVTPVNDAAAEGNESVVLSLTGGAGYVVGSPSSATVLIADDDATEPILTISVSDDTGSETGPNNAVFVFSRTGDTSQPLNVSWTFSGTAINGTDYQELPTSSPFPNGLSDAPLTIVPIDDALVEGSETVTVTLVDGPGYTLGAQTSATITILDNDSVSGDPEVTVVATDPNADEDGPDSGTFTISRTGSTAASLAVNYTVAGTATASSDYAAIGTSVTIPAGMSSTTVTVNPVDDAGIEGNESVILNLAGGGGYTVGSPSSATIVIADNDATEPILTISVSDGTGSETGSNNAVFVFSRTGDTSQPLNVSWTFSGTAINGTDFQELPTTSAFPNGLSDAPLTIIPIDDALVEGDETVTVTLVDGPGYTLGAQTSATITITDNDSVSGDPEVTVVATDATATESGNTTGTYTISRTGSTSTSLTVNFSVAGTATVTSDYASIGTSATIPSGSSSTTVTVTPVNDSDVEGGETVILNLSGGAGYTVGSPSSATINIVDDDAAEPVLTISVSDGVSSESGPNNGVFVLSRTGDTSQPLNVSWTFSGTAINGTDFQELPTSSPFPNGLSDATLTITPIDDALVEGSETVTVTLVDGPGYTLGAQTSATITITDND